MEIKKVVGGLVMSVLLGGCVGGVSNLGQATLRDGSIVEVVASKSKGNVGARITRLDAFQCRKDCDHLGSANAASDGLIDRAISSIIPAALLGGGAVSAARMLRPARTTIQVDADAISQGGSGGFAVNNNIPLSNTDFGITINK